LWMPWLQACKLQMQTSETGYLAYWEGEHNGYLSLKAPVRFRRGILRLEKEHWLVCDRLTSSLTHDYRLHWLFPDYPITWDPAMGQLTLATPRGAYDVRIGAYPVNGIPTLVRAEPNSSHGWQSPYYSQHERANSMELTIQSDRLIFWTVFGPGVQVVADSPYSLTVMTEKWQASLRLSGEEELPILNKVQLTGGQQDELDVGEN
jgi:hypothetical protein